VALTGLTLLLSEFVLAGIFGERTSSMIALISPVWLAMGIGAPSQALLQRELRFARLSTIEAVSVVVGAVVAVVAAALDLGGYALVLGGLTVVVIASVMALVSHRIVVPRLHPTEVRASLAFGTPVALSSLTYVAYRNVDYAILAARTSPVVVGYYYRAFQLGVAYQSKITRVMLRISLPVYARTKDLAELRRVRMRIVRTHATVIVPLLAAFIPLAPVVVPWLFGPNWQPAVVPAQIMAVAGMAEAITTGSGPLMVAIGKPGALLRWNLGVLASYATMIFLLAPHGLTAVAIGVAGFGVCTVIGMQYLLLRPSVGLSLRDLWVDVAPGLVAGACVLGAVYGVRAALSPAEVPVLVLLAASGVTAAGVYALVLKTAFPAVWVDLGSVTGRVRGRRKERAEPRSPSEPTPTDTPPNGGR
jgi:lipopolysaccharide exporter